MAPSPLALQQLLTPPQAARLLQVSVSSLYSTAFRERNHIPAPMKIGRLRRWKAEELREAGTRADK